jgi:prophage antirepressor-like protein
MQQLIKNFDFNGHGVRVITNEENQVFFVAKDVCDVLGYTKASSTVIQTHCKLEGVTKMVIPSDGGNQEQFIINEGNLYRLVLKSKKKEAEKFESWVCDEVLPAIRKTGKYDATQPKVMSIEELIIA